MLLFVNEGVKSFRNQNKKKDVAFLNKRVVGMK